MTTQLMPISSLSTWSCLRPSSRRSIHRIHNLEVVYVRPFISRCNRANENSFVCVPGFYINLPIGALVALLLVFIDIPDQAAKPPFKEVFNTITHKLDLTGFVLFAPAAIQLLLALDYGQNKMPWHSAAVIGLFCGAGGTFILFLAWEYYQGDKAMIPLAMVAKRKVWSSCLVMVSIFAITLSTTYYLPVYFQAIQNKSPMMSGVYILPSILSQLAVAVTSGALSE